MKIKLNNICLFGYHGLYEQEKKEGQNFTINISIELNHRESIPDTIDDTVDYTIIADTVKEIFNLKRYNLIESLASDIVERILLDLRVKSALVSIKKTNPPMDIDIESVEAIVERYRD